MPPHLQSSWSCSLRISSLTLGRVIMWQVGLSHSITPRHILRVFSPSCQSNALESLLFGYPLFARTDQWVRNFPVCLNSVWVKSRSIGPSGQPSHNSSEGESCSFGFGGYLTGSGGRSLSLDSVAGIYRPSAVRMQRTGAKGGLWDPVGIGIWISAEYTEYARTLQQGSCVRPLSLCFVFFCLWAFNETY